jgi:hypothetical protein
MCFSRALSEKIKGLIATNKVEAAPEHIGKCQVSAEIPIASRILCREAERAEEPTTVVNGVELAADRNAGGRCCG